MGASEAVCLNPLHQTRRPILKEGLVKAGPFDWPTQIPTEVFGEGLLSGDSIPFATSGSAQLIQILSN